MTHTVHLRLEQLDNPAMQRLCGALDANLHTLARALEVEISRRFDQLTFLGEQAHAAGRALEALALLAQSRDISDNDIQLAAVEAKTADAHYQAQTHEHAYHFRTRRYCRGILKAA